MIVHDSKSAFIFGCGYLGIRVARRLLAEGWQVSALTRRPERAEALCREGIRACVGDWNSFRTLRDLPPAAHVLVAVGYDPRGGRSRHEVYVEGLRNALRVIAPASRVCYVSSTGVFHQTDGGWVDETSPCHPMREGGRALLRAESLLRHLREGQPIGSTVVLRMAGLYGPDRVPRAESIRRGEPIAAAKEGFLNLIHVDDAAACVVAAWKVPHPAALYLVADGCPVIRQEYFEEIARLTGSPAPRFTAPPAAPPGTTRSESNKRIWNSRMRRDLLPRPQYPSYREGLRAILRPR